MNPDAPENRLGRVEKQVTTLRLICTSQFVVFVFGIWFLSINQRVEASGSDQVLHVRGLVVDDAQGRARVVLGAPFPTVTNRLRQNEPTESMIFLDEKGHDRLTLGEQPTPQIDGKVPPNYHRIGAGFGVLIHDGDGNERGGMGWNASGRATFALDRPGLDAIGAYVDDRTGFAGMVVEYPKDVADDVNAIEIGTQGKHAFFRFKDVHDKVKASVTLDDGVPHVTTSMLRSRTHNRRLYPTEYMCRAFSPLVFGWRIT